MTSKLWDSFTIDSRLADIPSFVLSHEKPLILGIRLEALRINYSCSFFFSFLFFFLFVVNFVIHWNEKALGSHVFPIPIPPPTSLNGLACCSPWGQSQWGWQNDWSELKVWLLNSRITLSLVFFTVTYDWSCISTETTFCRYGSIWSQSFRKITKVSQWKMESILI